MIYWINDLSNKAPATRLKYQGFFQKFCAFANKTPNELMEQRRIDLKSDDPREQRAIENLLKSFMVEMKDQRKSPATQQIAFAAVKSFFECNEYPLRTKRSDYPKGESLGCRAITKQVVREILDDTKRMKDKLKMRALILFLKDTGLRISDVRNLNYGHVAEGLEKNLSFIPLQLVTQKAKTVAKTFIGPEAIEALKLYFDERRKGTQRISAETITKDSPLFRTNEQGKVKRISRGGLSSIIRFQCLKTGATRLSAHSFRKYLQTSLDAAGVSPNFTDQIIGHKLINSRDAYSLPTDEMLLKVYTDAYPTIRIYPDKTEVEERVSKLESEIAERNSVIAGLASTDAKKTGEVQDLQGQVSSLKSQMETMTRMMSAIYQGNVKRVQLQDKPELPVWQFSDEQLQKVFNYTPQQVKELKEKLRKMREAKAP